MYNNYYEETKPRFQNYCQLSTNRNVGKFIIFSILTLGIYSIYFFSKVGKDVNVLCDEDDKNTIHFCVAFFILSPITCGIYMLFWMHSISARIGEVAIRQRTFAKFSESTFWIFGFLLNMFTFGITYFVFIHKLCTVMNELCENYNQGVR